MEPTIFTSWVRPERRGEVNSGEMLTEQSGYIPMEVQVREMELAGERMAAMRSLMYDAVDEKDVDVPGELLVLRDRGADLVEVQRVAEATAVKLKAAAAELEKRAADAKAKAEAKAKEDAEIADAVRAQRAAEKAASAS